MTAYYKPLLLFLLVFSSLSVAVGQAGDARKTAEISADEYLDDSEAVSQKLQSFIKGAVESGLLQSDTPAARRQDSADAARALQCKGLKALEFGDFTLLKTYEEFVEFRRLLTNSKKIKRSDADILLVKAYISLGLEAEARLRLKMVEADGADILTALVALLQGAPAALAERLKDAALCSPEARFWYGVALINYNVDQGGELVQQGMIVFRTLPFQLQVNVAAHIIPILERMDKKLLLQKIMASFTAEEIQSSSQLQFNQALMDMSMGYGFDMRRVESFLDKPSTSDHAMRVVLSQDQQPHLINQATRTSEAVRFILQADTQLDKATRLHVVIKAFAAAHRFDDIRSLSETPLLSGQKFQHAMAHSIVSHISQRIDSPSVQTRVSAINFLLQDNGLLLKDMSGRQLMQEAVTVAQDSGFPVLANLMLEKLDNPLEALPDKLAFAYRRKDHAQIYALADAHATHLEAAFYAGLSAIDQGEAERFARYEPILQTDPARLLQLFEADILAGSQLLSTDSLDVLEKAVRQEGAASGQLERYERAALIRQRGQATAAPEVPDFADISDLLAANRRGLGALSERTGL